MATMAVVNPAKVLEMVVAVIETVITVDIYCSWEAEPPAYRVYIDDNLLTERTYLWRNTDHFVRENIVISTEPGEHQFRLEAVNTDFKGFHWQNFTINNQPVIAANGQFILN